MDDPWDVKSVRKSGQYTSCMKLNGIPLLPPVLSKECRSEMQYYRLLAKEVEKRISILQPYVESDTDSNEDKTDAPEISECVRDNTVNDVVQLDPSHKFVDCIKDIPQEETRAYSPLHRGYNCSVTDSSHPPSHLILDFSLNINENINEINNSFPEPIEIPERDYNCMKSGDMLQDVAMKNMKCKQNTIVEEIVNFSFSIGRDPSIDSTLQDSSNHTGPSSLTTKSFTGSLNNIHTQNDENNHNPLVRQHSYTILNPSPQLLAHLEVQSLNLGVDMSCISMSESLTNLSCPGKKRRSWDLETAKVKWSNMALELKQKNLSRPNPKKNSSKGPPLRNLSPTRAKCVAAARTKYSSLSLKSTVRTEGLQRPQTTSPPKTKSPLHTRTSSPVRETPSNSTIILEEPLSMRTKTINSVKEIKNGNTKIVPKGEVSNPESHKKEPLKTPNHKNPHQKNVSPYQQKNLELVKSSVKKQGNDTSKPVTSKQLLVSEAHDPAAKVRELYEKIQKQHYLQMASLVEKQKREQMLLQQAFEEQNNLLFKQLKTICPTSPDKIKEAWAEKTDKPDRGPVSLSQLISPKVPDNLDSPLSSTLTDTNKCINFCNEVLKKSKDISSTIKSNGKPHSQIDAKNQPMIESRTRTNSPVGRNTPTSRKLNYDTSASSDRDYDLMLTDRTNDTLADLNVTFPSDSEECRPANHSPLCAAELTVIHRTTPIRSTDSAISYMEQTIQKSMNSCSARPGSVINNCQLPTPKQLAAASTIVAYTKGYLVRRLMKTGRVQSTVQTIKDALLCALQLHQDREGIRGADVDLHRRLIQQITAACYSLHDTFITSSPGERCAMIAADRSRRASLASRPPAPSRRRHSDVMSQSHTGSFPPRQKRVSAPPVSLMTQSNYEAYSSEAQTGRARYMPSPRRPCRPWR